MPYPFIIYDTHEGRRKMVVIDGQPFYQSTGGSSGKENCWLPFFLISGKKPINVDLLPDHFNKQMSALILQGNNFHGWIMKFSKQFLKNPPPGIFTSPTMNLRMPCLKECLIPALRLTGRTFPEIEKLDQVLTKEECALVDDPILLNQEEDFRTDNPEAINQWLVDQGATVARGLFPELVKTAEIEVVFHEETPPSIHLESKNALPIEAKQHEMSEETTPKKFLELIQDQIYWKSKCFSNRCPGGIIQMQKVNILQDNEPLFAAYKEIATARLDKKNVLSQLINFFPSNVTRDEITINFYRAIRQSNSFEDLYSNPLFQTVLENYQSREPQSNRPGEAQAK